MNIWLILPQEWASLPSFAQHPIGTGAYQVIANDRHKLQIKAFNRYFGLRALLDEIDMQIVYQPRLRKYRVHKVEAKKFVLYVHKEDCSVSLKLIEENDIEKLVALMGDKDSVRQMVLSQIEKSFHPGQQLLRIRR